MMKRVQPCPWDRASGRRQQLQSQPHDLRRRAAAASWARAASSDNHAVHTHGAAAASAHQADLMHTHSASWPAQLAQAGQVSTQTLNLERSFTQLLAYHRQQRLQQLPPEGAVVADQFVPQLLQPLPLLIPCTLAGVTLAQLRLRLADAARLCLPLQSSGMPTQLHSPPRQAYPTWRNCRKPHGWWHDTHSSLSCYATSAADPGAHCPRQTFQAHLR